VSRASASVRYAWALLFSTQRWVAPALFLVGLIAWVWNTPPLSVDTVRISLLVLFALAAWLGHSAGSVEEAGQELVSSSSLGSAARLLLAKWTVAAVISAAFPSVMVTGSFAWSQYRVSRGLPPLLSAEQAWMSVIAVLVVAACGAAVGILVASLLPTHPGWGAGVLVLSSLAQAAPGWPTVAMLADTLPRIDQRAAPSVAISFAVGLALTGGVLMAAVAVRRPAG
jgi:hypothetical protein